MEPVFAFNTAVLIAWWTGISLTVVSMLCMLMMLVMRVRTASVRERRKEAVGRIEPLLFKATAKHSSGGSNDADLKFGFGEEIDRTKLKDKQMLVPFLEEWNYIHESLEGEAKLGLNELVNSLDLYDNVIALAHSSHIDRQLIAINTLGNMKAVQAYDDICAIAGYHDPILSSWAWRALTRIDTERLLANDLNMIVSRSDWSPIFVAEVLHEIDADLLSQPLCGLVSECFNAGTEERQMSRMISYLGFTHISDHRPLVEQMMDEASEKEVLIACLRLIEGDHSLARVRQLAHDERWEIRLQAVLTLGRLGHDEDVDILIAALDDPDWWVRYRSASALLQMPSMSDARIAGITTSLPNQFAREILMQVQAEMELSCFKPSSLALSK